MKVDELMEADALLGNCGAELCGTDALFGDCGAELCGTYVCSVSWIFIWTFRSFVYETANVAFRFSSVSE